VEPHDRFALRCAELRTVLAATGDGDGLLVVCHWGVIRGLTGLEVDNCALVAFDPAPDGRPAVLLE